MRKLAIGLAASGAIALGLTTAFLTTHEAKVVSNTTSSQNTAVAPPKAPEKPPQLSAPAIIALVNDYRVKNGLPTLIESPALDKSAMQKCQDMATYDYFAHANPQTGIHGTDYAKQAMPYESIWGENLESTGQTKNEVVVSLWEASLGHRANILKSVYTYTGVAVCMTQIGQSKNLIVQHFAN